MRRVISRAFGNLANHVSFPSQRSIFSSRFNLPSWTRSIVKAATKVLPMLPASKRSEVLSGVLVCRSAKPVATEPDRYRGAPSGDCPSTKTNPTWAPGNFARVRLWSNFAWRACVRRGRFGLACSAGTTFGDVCALTSTQVKPISSNEKKRFIFPNGCHPLNDQENGMDFVSFASQGINRGRNRESEITDD